MRILSFIFILSVFTAETQTLSPSWIEKVNSLGQIVLAQESTQKDLANQEIIDSLLVILNQPNSFAYNFDSLKSVKVLTLKNKLRVFTWAFIEGGGYYRYFGFLQIKSKDNEFKIIPLKDKSSKILRPEQQILTPENWYGALYYDIIPHRKGYTLLGWDGSSKISTKKIIDFLVIEEDNITFGKPVFKEGLKTYKRKIYEYAKLASMSLKYNEQTKQIIFDYLIPLDASLKNIKAYYSPSMNRFDAFRWEGSQWLLQEDIPVKLPESKQDAFYGKKPASREDK